MILNPNGIGLHVHAHGPGMCRSFFELADLAFCETNPIPAKTACAALGLCRDELRLPLVPMTAANKERLLAGLTKHGLLAAAC